MPGKAATKKNRKPEPPAITYFDPAAVRAAQDAAIAAADGDTSRLLTLNPCTIVVLNFSGFPTDRWTKKDWRA